MQVGMRKVREKGCKQINIDIGTINDTRGVCDTSLRYERVRH